MLTGFDSKWINTLYLDKTLHYENIIQAFSRTNRLFGPDKPFGTIRYYRWPHTMERNIDAAVRLYSGSKPLGMFVDRLNKNLENMNHTFRQIQDLFNQSDMKDFISLPSEITERKKFAELFRTFNEYLEAAKIQGFRWNQLYYENKEESRGELYQITVEINEKTYRILALRYKELFHSVSAPGSQDVPYDIVGYLTEINTDVIDNDYMNSRFDKYLKFLHQEDASGRTLKQAEEELHKTFAALSQEEQKYANIFLHDIQRGDVVPEEGKTLRDYITEYQSQAQNTRIHQLAVVLGLDESQLKELSNLRVTEANINEFGRFDSLKATVDRQKARIYFEKLEGTKIIPPKVNMKVDKLLRNFLIHDSSDIAFPEQ